MLWVECPLMLIKGTKVEITQCLSCTQRCGKFTAGAGDMIKTYFQQAVDSTKAAGLLENKKRRRQMCPVTSVDRLGYCTAYKKYCRYNTVCADNNPAMEKNIVYTEKKMLIVKMTDGKTSQLPKSIKTFMSETKDFRNIESVTESVIGVRVVTELLPQDGKAVKKDMPKELKNVVKVLSDSEELTIAELLQQPVGTEAWVPATVYKPQTRLEVFKAPGVAPRRNRPSTKPTPVKEPTGV